MRTRSRAATVALVALVAGAAIFVTMAALLTPWDYLPGGSVTAAPVDRFFTTEQIERSNSFFDAVKWSGWINLVLSSAVALVLGFTSVGRRLVSRVRRHVRRWWLQVVVLVVLVTGAQRLVTLPAAARSEHVSREYGLSTQSWASWAGDLAKSFAVTTGLTCLALVLLMVLARRFRRTWFVPAALAAAALTMLASFAYPVVFEPLFNKFTPLADGPLRTQLIALATRDGVSVSDVLVADASRRTTALNAYVSGFGSTKRIVIYDTLLKSASDKEIEMIVAHELGHATHDDVLVGTLEGTVAVATAVVALFLLLRIDRIRGPTGAGSMSDPGVVPVVLALVTVAGLVALPVQNTISRHIEARADLHALDLTRDPTTFISIQRQLALRNLSHLEPNPVLSFIFSNHPPTLDRIGMAVAWARLHDQP